MAINLQKANTKINIDNMQKANKEQLAKVNGQKPIKKQPQILN